MRLSAKAWTVCLIIGWVPLVLGLYFTVGGR